MIGFSEGFVPGLHKCRGSQGGVVKKSQDSGCLIPNDVPQGGGFTLGLQVSLLELELPLSGCNACGEVVYQGTFTISKWAV